jgi:hypothetical protein
VSNWIKVMLICSVCFVLLIVAAVGLGAYWLSKHKNELLESGMSARREGAEFGRKSDDQGCLAEGLRRHRERHGFGDAILNNLFLNGCFETTRPTGTFCEGVPRSSEMMESIRWRIKKCADERLSDSYCGNLFAEVQKYCDSDKAHSKSPSQTPSR